MAHVLLEHLEREGVRHIFGIPGGPIMPLYEAVYARGRMRPILAKHEAGAAFMADGYARASGVSGVCCTTTGPGATNALTGLAVSFADQVPVLLLTPQVPTHQFGMGAFQESGPEGIDLVGLYSGVTKSSAMVPHPERAGPAVRAALRAMSTGRPGPAHLNIPLDYITKPVAQEAPPPAAAFRQAGRPLDRAAARAAAGLLREARRPAILAGSGVNSARAWEPLRSLAELLQAPVATTFRAKGALPEDHPLSLGVFGYCGSARARQLLLDPETDLLLVVGSSLGEVSTCGFDPRLRAKRIIQADVDPRVIGRNFPVAVGVAGDAQAVLLELLDALGPGLLLPRRAAPPPAPACPPPGPPAARGLDPRSLLRELEAALPPDAMLFVDNGSIRAWCGEHLTVRSPGSFYVNMGMASMGWATAAVVGAKLACPRRPAVALAGDAAFLMNGTEVHTAVEHRVPVTWVVLNNGGHGMIYHGEKAQFGGKFVSSVFRRPVDVAGMARAMGARALRVERPGQLEAALTRPSLDGPLVLDVAADLQEPPPMSARVRSLETLLGAAPRPS